MSIVGRRGGIKEVISNSVNLSLPSQQNDFQGARMEERLDDAINVLRNHCEPQMLGLGGPGGIIDPSLLAAGGSLQAMANSATNPGVVKQERPGPGSE